MREIPFCCPVCGMSLEEEPSRVVCPQGHCFDRAAKGYWNLLLPQKKHSAMPGDDPESLRARRVFLEEGYYQPLSDKINRVAGRLLEHSRAPLVADCCCGEGYYIRRLYHALETQGLKPQMAGFDISKYGIKMASSRACPIVFAVASVFRIPLPEQTVDLALHAFAPFCGEEVERILKPGGYLIGVIPGRRHLFGLKSVLYENPYENDEEGYHTGLSLLERIRVCGTIRLEGPEKIARLFQMTPYFYRSREEAAKRLLSLQVLETEIDFILQIFKK